MTTIDKVKIGHYRTYDDAFKSMEYQGVKHLGWANDNKVVIPDHLEFTQVYANRSGTMCLYVDVIHRVSYSVDMGD